MTGNEAQTKLIATIEETIDAIDAAKLRAALADIDACTDIEVLRASARHTTVVLAAATAQMGLLRSQLKEASDA